MSCETVYSEQIHVQHPSDSVLRGFDFTELLADGETLTGTPVITPSPASGITLGSPAVNVATFPDDDGNTVAIGKGVQCRVSGLTAGQDYNLRVVCSTSDSNTFGLQCLLQCRS